MEGCVVGLLKVGSVGVGGSNIQAGTVLPGVSFEVDSDGNFDCVGPIQGDPLGIFGIMEGPGGELLTVRDTERIKNRVEEVEEMVYSDGSLQDVNG